jgi:hypothetical protein
MIKVQILTRCTFCDGEAYVPIGQATDEEGGTCIRYCPCPYCEGSGERAKWIPLAEFAEMLNDAANTDPMAPDWLELAHKEPISQSRDSRDAAGI